MAIEGYEWPPNFNEEVTRRLNLYNMIAQDEELRADFMLHYKHNPVDWINDWCVTYDPRNRPPLPRVMPFILFPRQVEFVYFLKYCYDNNISGLIEKCRDMGASWVCCAFSVWLWLFHDGSAIGWGSRKEEYVDKNGDNKALFPKMRQIIEHLPVFMLPTNFKEDRHEPFMRILNPENGSTITGEAGDNIGRGGRTSIYFKDESAHYLRPDLVEAALGDNTDVQIDISSVNGTANVFYRRRINGVEWKRGITIPRNKTAIFVMDWRDHPAKTQEWYDDRRSKAEGEGLMPAFAQEVDRDYAAAVDCVVIPAKWVNAAVDAHIKLGIEPEGTMVAGQDIADGGKDKNALAVTKGVILQYIEAWGGEAGDAATVSIPKCTEMQVDELYYDSVGVGAGFKAGVNILEKQGKLPERLKVYKWAGSQGVIDPEANIIKNDRDSPLNKDHFANLKAQAWFKLRSRFSKTYLAVTQGREFPHDELISLPSNLPNVHQLKLELSQAVYKHGGSGKLVIDKTPDGASSPNLADACTMCYCPNKRTTSFDNV